MRLIVPNWPLWNAIPIKLKWLSCQREYNITRRGRSRPTTTRGSQATWNWARIVSAKEPKALSIRIFSHHILCKENLLPLVQFLKIKNLHKWYLMSILKEKNQNILQRSRNYRVCSYPSHPAWTPTNKARYMRGQSPQELKIMLTPAQRNLSLSILKVSYLKINLKLRSKKKFWQLLELS